MKRIRFLIISITLIATLANGFMYSFLSNSFSHSLKEILHQKSSKEMLSQQYFLEENEFEVDEKSNEVTRPLIFSLTVFALAVFVINQLRISQLFGFSGVNFRPNLLEPIYLSNQVFRN